MATWRIEIKWAMIFVFMALVWMMMEKAVGLHDTHIDKHPIYTNFIAIPAILIYVFALLEKRKKSYGGRMTYVQGLMAGLKITAIVTLFSPVTQYITSTFITPDYFNNVIAYVVKHDMMTRDAAEDYFNLNNYIMQSLVGSFIMGLITSLLVSIFTKKS